MVTLKVIQAAFQNGEGTISVSVGQIVQAEPADYADTSSEWLWVKCLNGVTGFIFCCLFWLFLIVSIQGYVPREFVRIQ